MNTTRLSLSGISCAGCVSSVETALNDVDGVVSASVNFAERTATIEGNASVATLLSAVSGAGYEAAELLDNEDEGEKEAAEMAHYRKLLRKAVVAAAVGFPLFVLGMSGLLPGLGNDSGRVFWLLVGVLTAGVLVYSGGLFAGGILDEFRMYNRALSDAEITATWDQSLPVYN